MRYLYLILIASFMSLTHCGNFFSEPPKSPTPEADSVKIDEKEAEGLVEEFTSKKTQKYSIQVGSYARKENAYAHSEKLKSQDWNAYYIEAQVKGQSRYRVLVGLFDNKKKAEDFLAQFKKKTETEAAIVQKLTR